MRPPETIGIKWERRPIMNIVRRSASPLSALRPAPTEDQLGRLVESMFGELFTPFARGTPLWSEEGTTTPRLDLHETDKTFEVQAELPGVKKDDVKVSIDHQRITIEAECRTANERREGENVVYSERSARKFMRSFMLPSEVDDTTAQAKLENGILSLSLPKKQGSEARRLTIQ
jgi:HSP20 family protein